MSKEINVKFENVSKEIMVVGAETLGLEKVKEGSYALPNGRNMVLEGEETTFEFYGMAGKSLGQHKIKANTEEGLASEVIGVIRRAGLTETVATHLINDDFETERNVSDGTVRATRRDEVITVRVGLDGLMNSDMGGFEGEACSLTMQKLLDKLPQGTIQSETPKVENAHVVRTPGLG